MADKIKELLEKNGQMIIDGSMSTALEQMGANLNCNLWTARASVSYTHLICLPALMQRKSDLSLRMNGIMWCIGICCVSCWYRFWIAWTGLTRCIICCGRIFQNGRRQPVTRKLQRILRRDKGGNTANWWLRYWSWSRVDTGRNSVALGLWGQASTAIKAEW